MTWAEFRLARYRRPLMRGGALAVLVVVAARLCEVSLGGLIDGLGKGLELVGLFVPPDVSVLPDMLEPAVVTLLLALVATPIGAVASVVVGLAAARNVAPRWLRQTARAVIAIERGLPEIVTLLILVAAFGIGPVAGIMALSIASIGMLGKLVADAIEEVDPRVVDAVSCVGATRAQVIRFAVLPLVVPSLVTNALFRLEVNIRASVLLGAVGAGGIGYELSTAMTQLEYPKATVAALTALALVFAVERTADLVRARLLTPGGLA